MQGDRAGRTAADARSATYAGGMSKTQSRWWMVIAGLFVTAWVLTLFAVANGESRFGVYTLTFSTVCIALTYCHGGGCRSHGCGVRSRCRAGQPNRPAVGCSARLVCCVVHFDGCPEASGTLITSARCAGLARRSPAANQARTAVRYRARWMRSGQCRGSKPPGGFCPADLGRTALRCTLAARY